MTSTKLSQFECIGDLYANKLKEAFSIENVDDFFALNKNVEDISEKIQVDEKRVQQWFDVMDLFRIPNVSSRTAELLYYANVNSVEELSHRQASRIYYKFKEIDVETYFIILALPTFAEIDQWIYYAKLMSRRIKIGLNIPLANLKMLSLSQVSELSKYNIITIEDFVNKSKLIRGVRNRLKMSKDQYDKFLGIISLLEIDGIDVYIAETLQEAGIPSKELLKNLTTTQILNGWMIESGKKKIPVYGTLKTQEKQDYVPETITEELLNKFKNKILEESN